MRKVTLFLLLSALAANPSCSRSSSSQSRDRTHTIAIFAEPVAKLDFRVLFYNPPALEILREAKLKLPEMEDEARRKSFAAACRNPDLFRRLDRRYRFDALLLSGNPVEYRPLLDHLIQTKDWKLVHLDAASLIFRRGDVEAWEPQSFTASLKNFDQLSEATRTDVLVQLGNKLLAIDQPRAAREALDAALAIREDSAAAHTAMALYHTRFRRWDEAIESSSKALKSDSKFIPALATKSQLLFSTGKASTALEFSRRLVSLSPNAPNHLLLPAKICHQAHAYEEEISVLAKLVNLALQQKVPAASYRIYLTQAYAANGQGSPAVQQFEAALSEGNLSSGQEKYVRESIEKIRSRTPW